MYIFLQLIWLNQCRIQGLIMSGDRVDPVVTSLVDSLFSATRDSDGRVVLLAGECLGLIGAVDPGRLDPDRLEH